MTPEALARAVLAGDHTRGPAPGRGGPWKEWHHFAVLGPGVDLVLNLNLGDDLRAGGSTPVGRLIVLARRAGAWVGGVSPATGLRAPPGRLDVAAGGARLTFEHGRYRLRCDDGPAGFSCDLAFTPVTAPALSTQVPFDRGARVDWLFVPRLTVGGTATLDGGALPIDGALAYHDHNWGHFHWGADFAWEWGFVLPDDPASPWSLVFTRLMDRRRRAVRSQGVFLWEGARQVASFVGPHMRTALSGQPPAGPPFDLPPVMGLLAPGDAPGVPGHVGLTARDGLDHLEADIDIAAVARLLVPDEADAAACTLLAETTGRARVRGRVRDRSVHLDGRAVVEFVRGETQGPPLPLDPPRAAAPPPALPHADEPALFRSFLAASLAVIEAEHPGLSARLRVALAGRPARFSVDGPPARVVSTPRLAVEADGPAAVSLTCSHATVLALVDGATTLSEAARSGALELRGTPSEIAGFHDALLIYLHAAVRSATLPALLARYRAAVANEGGA